MVSEYAYIQVAKIKCFIISKDFWEHVSIFGEAIDFFISRAVRVCQDFLISSIVLKLGSSLQLFSEYDMEWLRTSFDYFLDYSVVILISQRKTFQTHRGTLNHQRTPIHPFLVFADFLFIFLFFEKILLIVLFNPFSIPS